MDSSCWSRSNVLIFTFFLLEAGLIGAISASYPSPYNNAVHYWPLDIGTGVRDVVTGITGIRDGRVKSILLKGPGPGYLFIPKSRLKFGSFKGTCIVDPSKCSTYLTVSLWIKYNRKGTNIRHPTGTNRTQFFVGTSTQKNGSPGFAIHSTPLKGQEERIRFQIENGQRVWTGYTNVKHRRWTQVGFTWSNSTGLVIYKNCKRIQSIKPGRLKTSTGPTGDYLYLVKAPGRGKAAFNISYDDVAVWYRDLRQVDKGLICSKKVGPPVLSKCSLSGPTWIFVQWKPSLPDYDILMGFNVWYKYTTSKDWVKLVTKSTNYSFNITGLDLSSTVEIQVQNKIHGGNGQSSHKIICNSSNDKTVLGSPINLTVEATSSRAILLSWKPPADNYMIRGYWVLYKDNDSIDEFTKVQVGLPVNNQFLISGLIKNTSYKIYVVSIGAPNNLPSKPTELNAVTDKDDSKTVPSINANPLDLRTLRLSWRPPAGSTKRHWYKVFMQWKDRSINSIQEIYRGRSTSYTFVSSTDLPFPQECNVMVMPPSLVKAPVQNATIQSTSWNSAVITWASSDSHVASEVVDNYRIIVTSPSKTVQFVTNKPKATIGGLSQMTSYRVNIQQGNSKGFGSLMDHDVVFRTEDANECADLESSCDGSENTLIFDDSECYKSFLQCDSHAQCINTEGSYFCKCNQGYIGDGWMCQEIPSDTTENDFCKEETFQEITWGRTLRGQQETTPCPKGVTGIASRQCIGPSDQPAMWDVPDLSHCVSQWALDMNDLANDPSVSSSSVADQTANLTDTQRVKDIYPGDLKVVVNIIGILSNREDKKKVPLNTEETIKFTRSVASTASNILDSQTINKWTFIPQTERKRKAGALLSTMDSVALQMTRTGNRSRTTMPNVVLDVFSTSNISSSKNVVIGASEQKDSQPYAVFPSSELSQGSQRVTYISYRTLGALLAPQANDNTSVESSVVSLTVSGLKRSNFNEPVTIIFAQKQRDIKIVNSSCVFWDMTSEPGHWSRDGCYVNSTNSSHTICHCYHLTSFAVLMNVKGDTSHLIKGRHKIALALITYIGCVLSITALCLTFVTFLTFRFLKSSRTFIHTNLAFALILAQLLFLFGINKTKVKLMCQIIAGALHYIWLASFVWMALEGVMLYLMLVKVFGTKTMTRKRRIIFLTIGWCLPLIVVGVSAGIHPQGYGTEYYCWLSIHHGFIWAFVGPALLVIGFNFIMMGVAFSVMSNRGGHRRKPSKIRRIRSWAKACTLLTCILGLTWLFGVFYINHETLFMAYFFTIFNSLQGVFIFLFHCIGDEKIRREYVRIICCQDKGPPYTKTPRSDDSSSAGKLLKSTDNKDSKVVNFHTGSTGTDSSDGHKPVLVMYQKRSSYGPREDSESSQRISGEIIENPRDSLGSFSSFRNRYSLVSRDSQDEHGEPAIVLGELSIVQEVTVHNTSTET